MQEKFDSLIVNKTWGLSAISLNNITFSGKWIFRLKWKLAGEITYLKAQWVVKSFQQQENIDYNQMFASIV